MVSLQDTLRLSSFILIRSKYSRVGHVIVDADETSDVSYMASCITPFLPWAGIIPVSVVYGEQAPYSSEIYVSKYYNAICLSGGRFSGTDHLLH